MQCIGAQEPFIADSSMHIRQDKKEDRWLNPSCNLQEAQVNHFAIPQQTEQASSALGRSKPLPELKQNLAEAKPDADVQTPR